MPRVSHICYLFSQNVNESSYYFKYTPEYLSEEEGFLVIDRVESVGGDHACTELFTYSVCREAVHVHFHVSTDLLI